MARREMNPERSTDTQRLHSFGEGPAGTLEGAPYGPIGLLVGGSVSAIAGATAGHGVAERIDPAGEIEYWKQMYTSRTYYDNERTFETDYYPAYFYGVVARNTNLDSEWSDDLASDLKQGWEDHRDESNLAWVEALPAVRDAWERVDRSYAAYRVSDRQFDRYFPFAEYRRVSVDDYRSAYRFGTFAHASRPNRRWGAAARGFKCWRDR